MGGEKSSTLLSLDFWYGSPPRGRGKVAAYNAQSAADRITPAWAGKSPLVTRLYALAEDHPRVGGEKQCVSATTDTAKATRPVWDHPRMGGEKLGSMPWQIWRLGSPPRGRGKGICIVTPNDEIRITPAWAGKRHIEVHPVFVYEDHPRVGGEKFALCLFLHPLQGSPPRGRGKDMERQRSARKRRITPAWAGKSNGFAPWSMSKRDHPRVGGEKTKKIP